MADSKGILIIAEAADNKVTNISKELLGIGRKLAKDLGQELSAAILGKDVAGLAKELISYGADNVYVVQDPSLATYQPDAFLMAAEKVCKDVNPSVVLLGHTDAGRDLAPKLAYRLKAGLTTDCVELKVDAATKKVVQTKPVYGGNARADFVCETGLQMATIRPKAFEALEANASRTGNVVEVKGAVDAAKIRTKVLEFIKQEAKGVRLEDAPVVVSGGRGLGGPDPFKHLEELAKVLGGAVGASRAVCDAGWMPPTIQVGLTGKVVSPNLYIAVAISGASQHMAGCSGSKFIVAINKDKDANIFKEARYGVVGDWKEVLPPFIEMVKELRG